MLVGLAKLGLVIFWWLVNNLMMVCRVLMTNVGFCKPLCFYGEMLIICFHIVGGLVLRIIFKS